MKYIKTYENLPSRGEYKKNSYVLCDAKAQTTNKTILDFISSNIGQIIDIVVISNILLYKIKYENIPDSKIDIDKKYITNFFYLTDDNYGYRFFNFDEIILNADTKEEVKLMMNAKKYNL